MTADNFRTDPLTRLIRRPADGSRPYAHSELKLALRSSGEPAVPPGAMWGSNKIGGLPFTAIGCATHLGECCVGNLTPSPESLVVHEVERSQPPAPSKILFISADPRGVASLRIQDEFRRIQSELRASSLRDSVVFDMCLATRPADLSRALLIRPRPRVIHMSGHGTGAGAFCLQSDSGSVRPVDSGAVAAVLQLAAASLEIVVLNACYSGAQIGPILKFVPYVVGMTRSISDDAAIAYSVGFYQALFNQESVGVAHSLGCAQIQMVSPAEREVPILRSRKRAARV